MDLLGLSGQAFISTVFFQLKFSWNSSIPTAETNGTEVRVNPEFFLSCHKKGRVFLLAHEAWHVALDHITRGNTLDPQTYNEAADYVINGVLVKAGYEMPIINGETIGLHDPAYYDMTTEEVYALIKKSNNKPPPNMGGMGLDILGQKGSNNEAKKTKIKLDKIIKTAAITAEQNNKDSSWGDMPGDLEIYLNDLFNPKVDWRTLFINFFTARCREDFSYKKINRRYMPDFFLPSLYSEQINEVAFFCDSSGSVTDEDFNTFYGEAAYVKSVLNPKRMIIAAFDSTLKKVHEFSEHEPINVSFTGRGGTRIAPVINYINEKKSEINVIFTDGYFSKEGIESKENILWLIYNNPNFTADFGKIIHVDTREKNPKN